MIDRSGSPSVLPVRCLVAARVFSAPLLAVAILLAVPAAAAGGAAITTTPDVEGVGNLNRVGDYYGGGGGGPDKNYGVVFGPDAFGVTGDGWTDTDDGGSHPIANVPSPTTSLLMSGRQYPHFVTVLDGFAGLSFMYTSVTDVNVTVYDGPNLTGTVLGNATLPAMGFCRSCGGPDDPSALGLWRNFTVPFGGVARSAEFSVWTYFVLVDDMVLAHVPQPTPIPTPLAPTGPPTKAPSAATKRPTVAPTHACLKGRKGRNKKRCMMKKPRFL
jgi:hypothetical protein